jgi:GT2 family glycosyltransferase/SAM-dependent methyltransferase/glycosyltransferase involved in cell wall biosynthesis
MSSADKHAAAVALSNAGRHQEALALLCQLLGETDSSEYWNDWAALQFRLNHKDEAEAGFRLALEKNPQNTQAALNLGALLCSEIGDEEGESWLAQAAETGKAQEREAASHLLKSIEERPGHRTSVSSREIETYLRRFLSEDPNERSYFETHVRRYVATLKLLPDGAENSRVLELGAAFHHITPALATLKRYHGVRCNDIWRGSPQQTREISSNDGRERFPFLIDNFDVQNAPWPYPDDSFDAVLCCEMLEHLHSDPMCLLSEINRVLKIGGVLLLTTPNIAGAHAVEYALRGDSPYVYGRFERDGAPTDRHNREYTAGEVERLSRAAGLDPVALRTMNSWWTCCRDLMRQLVSQGYPIARRGDNTFLLARKQTTVRDRYPEEFYQVIGTQSDRRTAQAEDGVSPKAEISEDFEASAAKNILLIHEVLPHHDCSGSDLRLLDVIRELRTAGHHVTYLARNGKNAEQYRPQLEALGVKVRIDSAERLAAVGSRREREQSLAALLQNETFDIAILCHWFWAGMSVVEQYLTAIRRAMPQTRIVVVTDDRHGERERRAARLSGSLGDFERGNSFERREIEAYRQADLVLYITEADKRWFLELAPELETMHLPMVAEVSESGPSFSQRDGVLFLGNFDNPANGDALAWMLSNVWPLVRKAEPRLTLYVVGHGLPDDAVRNHKNVVSLGQVDDLGPVFNARRVFASPVRYGTGINTKNVQAMSRGLPLVATSVSAEGIGLQDEIQGLIADTPEKFAANIVRLHRDEVLWNVLASNGQAFVRDNFSRDKLRSQLANMIRRCDEIPPRPLNPAFCWSYLRSEEYFADLVERFPHHRYMLGLFGYWLLGRQQMQEQRFAAALEQFRHAFTLIRDKSVRTDFQRELLSDMAKCYLETGDLQASERCKLELAKESSPDKAKNQGKKRPGSSLHHSDDPEISVVFPTYNRPDILQVALIAWAFQTLPSRRWEMIVVDDGSDRATEQICRTLHIPYRLRYVRQANQGAGAARRVGVEAARGKYLLLCNDDTIPDCQLLTEHLRVHRDHPKEKLAVLGEFRASPECARQALSFFVNTSTFFFPQHSLQAGQLLDQAYFVTCNLSVGHDAVLSAGNFDPQFRVAEDTELGTRLVARGYQVRYHPAARACHEHGVFATSDLIRRARAYGRADRALFAKHPRLLGKGESPFGLLSKNDLTLVAQRIALQREAVQSAVEGLEALDKINFLQCFKKAGDQRPQADGVLEQLAGVVPMVYWHYLLESFLECRAEDESAPDIAAAIHQNEAVGAR